jgi:serine/threonine protein kinase
MRPDDPTDSRGAPHCDDPQPVSPLRASEDPDLTADSDTAGATPTAPDPSQENATSVELLGIATIDHLLDGSSDPLTSALPSADLSYALATPTVPGYEVLAPLGEGGMGVVWKARQTKLNRLVVLKMVLGEQRAGSRELIRFLAEAEAVAAVRHPHVVQVYDYGEANGRPFLAMEYLPGGSLSDRLKQTGRLDPKAAAGLVATLARAVQAAHDLGIVHRDLKPGNVLYDERG